LLAGETISANVKTPNPFYGQLAAGENLEVAGDIASHCRFLTTLYEKLKVQFPAKCLLPESNPVVERVD